MGNTTSFENGSGSKLGEHLVAPRKGNPVIDYKCLNKYETLEEISHNTHWYDKNELELLLRSDDPQFRRQLRKYIHRDIFTTYQLESSIPERIQFDECYLIDRDRVMKSTKQTVEDVKIVEHEEDSHCRSHIIAHGLPTTERNVAQEHAYPNLSSSPVRSTDYYGITYEGSPDSSSSRSEESTSSNGMYSPPSSYHSSTTEPSPEIPQEKFQQVEHFMAGYSLEAAINRVAVQESLGKGRDQWHEGPHQQQASPAHSGETRVKDFKKTHKKKNLSRARSKSMSMLPNRHIPARPQHAADFDFLEYGTEKKGPRIYQQVDTIPTAKISVNASPVPYHEYRGKAVRNAISSNNRNKVGQYQHLSVKGPICRTMVEAGIPPKVPPHRVGVSNGAEGHGKPVWRVGHKSSLSDGSWVEQTGSKGHDSYTRKCSFVRKQTLSERIEDEKDKGEALKMVTTNEESSIRSGKREKTFMLPGYDHERKLQVVNVNKGDSIYCPTPIQQTRSLESLINSDRRCVSMYEPTLVRNPAVARYDESCVSTGYFGFELLESNSDARKHADRMWTHRGEQFLAKVGS